MAGWLVFAGRAVALLAGVEGRVWAVSGRSERSRLPERVRVGCARENKVAVQPWAAPRYLKQRPLVLLTGPSQICTNSLALPTQQYEPAPVARQRAADPHRNPITACARQSTMIQLGSRKGIATSITLVLGTPLCDSLMHPPATWMAEGAVHPAALPCAGVDMRVGSFDSFPAHTPRVVLPAERVWSEMLRPSDIH